MSDYAHQDVLNAEKKLKILEKATYNILGKIILRLLTIDNILFEAFHNGREPNFDYVNNGILEGGSNRCQLLTIPVNE